EDADTPTKEEYEVAKLLRFNIPILKKAKLMGMAVQYFLALCHEVLSANQHPSMLMPCQTPRRQAASQRVNSQASPNRNLVSTTQQPFLSLLRCWRQEASSGPQQHGWEKTQDRDKKKKKAQDETEEDSEKAEKKPKKEKKSKRGKEDEKEESSSKEKESAGEGPREEEEKETTLEMADQQFFMDGDELLVFVGFILSLCIVQRVLFAVVWLVTFGKHHFWLLPNLTEDVGFFESFKPFYKHDACPGKKDKADKEKTDGSGGNSEDGTKGQGGRRGR
ncbi:hypothetical protein LSAT2_023045, partial [Lamellibrachia satsuma]